MQFPEVFIPKCTITDLPVNSQIPKYRPICEADASWTPVNESLPQMHIKRVIKGDGVWFHYESIEVEVMGRNGKIGRDYLRCGGFGCTPEWNRFWFGAVHEKYEDCDYPYYGEYPAYWRYIKK